MESDHALPKAAVLARRIAASADTAQIADDTTTTWRQIDAALHPIIGRQGVAALFRRSIHVCSAAYPWLAQSCADSQPAIEFLEFRAVLAAQNASQAAAGAGAVLESFHKLLGGMIGPALTDQLLDAVFKTSFSGPPALDTSP